MKLNEFINWMMVFSLIFLVASATYIFPWAIENWVSIDGDVSLYSGQTTHYNNVLISVIPTIITLILIIISDCVEKRKENLSKR